MAENMDEYVTLTPGMEVHDVNGDKVGKIIEVNDDAIVVEKGFFLPKDYVISLALVDSVDEDDRVLLTVPKERLTEDVLGESSAADLELAGSTSFDPTIATGAGVIPQESGIDIETTETRRDDQ